MTAEAVTEVSDATFERDVLERSRELPVVVDFWAPWCGPCRVIGPILEQLAEEHAGRVQLVKLNVDDNPEVSAQYAIRSIPAVMAFRDGAPASQFVGAVPQPQAAAFFDSLLPSEADIAAEAGDAARAAGDAGGALARYEEALTSDRSHRRASIGLAALALDGGEFERAEQLAQDWADDAEGRRIATLARLRRVAAGADRGQLETRVAAEDGDAAAHYALGALLAIDGEWEPALEHLLATVRLDRKLDDDGARRLLLDSFNMFGDDHALTRDFRQRLASVLF